MRKKESHHLCAGVGAAGIRVCSVDAATGPCMRCTVDNPIFRINAVGGRHPPTRARAPTFLAVQRLGDGGRARAKLSHELAAVGGMNRRVGIAMKDDERPPWYGGPIVTVRKPPMSCPFFPFHRGKCRRT